MSRHLMDPELSTGLERHLPQRLNSQTLSLYRSMLFEMVAANPKPSSEAIRNVKVDDRRIPGLDGNPSVRALVYVPPNRGDAPLSAILHIHGGGFVSGNADMSDPNNRAYAVDMDCVVVSVDYRLAPEAPFPGPVEDCYAALLSISV